MLFKKHLLDLNIVLKEEEKKQLSEIGNHCKGATFYDANDLINDDLHRVFDMISIPIKGFHFGRFDIKIQSINDLYKGENIKILELNGANSEPTHIYDPKMPLWKAYRDMFSHWKVLFKISRLNNKNGVNYASSKSILKEIKKRL